MDVHFSSEVEARLQQVAQANGKNAEQLVRDTVERVLEDQARFVSAVQRGIAQAERGEFIEHEEVRARIERLIQQ
jgi:predicted transcriptional regulator